MLGQFLYLLELILSAWIFHRLEVTYILDTNQDVRILSIRCHEILPTRNFSHKTSVFASFAHSNIFWKIFESVVVSTQQVSLHWSLDQRWIR